MARPLRIEYPGAFYHVMNRGHRQEAIALDDHDRRRFLVDLERMAGQFAVLIHSYCLMPNHYHLLLETPEGNLSRAVQWLNVSYATYYNRRHRCAGHLFQGRFKAILVDAGTYLDALSRYIHLNPVRAGLVHDVSEYAWSSCRYFVEPGDPPPWLEVNRILGGFGSRPREARRHYAAYLTQTDAPDPSRDMIAGGILAAPPFVQWVRETLLSTRSDDPAIPDLKRAKARPSVQEIVREVADSLQVDAEHILAHGHGRNDARDIAIYLARELSGLSCRELGRCFGDVSGAAVTMRHTCMARRLAREPRLAKLVMPLRQRLVHA